MIRIALVEDEAEVRAQIPGICRTADRKCKKSHAAPEGRAWDFLLWALRAGAFISLRLWSKDRCAPELGAG